VFAILGVPLGVMNRRGGKASGFSLSIGISIIYWILYSAGQNLVSQGRLSPYVGLWMGNALLGTLGVILLLFRERSEGLQLSVLVPVKLQRTLTALRLRREQELRRRARGQMVGKSYAPAAEASKSSGSRRRSSGGKARRRVPESRAPLRAVASG